MLQPLIMYPGIWAQLTQHKHCQWGSKQIQASYSAVSIITVYSKNHIQTKNHKKQCRINVTDCFDVEFLCFTLLIFVCNQSFSFCMHRLGHWGWSQEQGIKPEDAPSILACYTDLHLPGRRQFMTCGNLAFPHYFSTWLGIDHGRSNQGLQESLLEGSPLITF